MKKIRILLPVLFFAIILMNISANNIFSMNEPSDIINKENLLRLHIIANSNSPKDQYLKRIIRDNVINYFEKNSKNMCPDLNDELNNINEFIENILKVKGTDYGAKTELGSYYFPGRTYDNLTLVQGEYKALKIVLGSGEGSNWWCVLLPPMCIENKEKDQKEEKIEFRSKLLEWIHKKKSEQKLAREIEFSKVIKLTDLKDEREDRQKREFKLIDNNILNLNILSFNN